MAHRFNSPPNWPAPPAGWTPPAGWQPDPAWGPVPEGWTLWIEDSTPAVLQTTGPATKKKISAGAIVAIAAGIAVTALMLGGLFYLYTSFEAGPPVEGVKRAGSIDEAKQVLQQTYDDAVAYADSHHGFEKEHTRVVLDEALDEGNRGTDIWSVEMQTSTLQFQLETMETASELWEEAWNGSPAFTDNRSGTELEAILDQYTGGTVDFSIDDECITATACVDIADPHTIHVNEKYYNNPAYVQPNYADVLLHEYAHVTQFKFYDELEYWPVYATEFNSDEEFHADCMAQSVRADFVSGYGSACSADDLASAKNVWEGVFTY